MAGTSLLVMGVLAGLAFFMVIEPLTVQGSPDELASTLVDSAGTVRLAAAGLVLVAILDVVVAWGLHAVLRNVHPDVSLLGAWFRVAYAAIFVMAISHLFGAVHAAPVDAAQAAASLAAFETGWQLALTLFGVHLAIIGSLAWRASYIHWIFGVLLAVSGLGYLIDGFSTVTNPDLATSISSFTFVGEVAFIFWLLIRGARLPDAAEQNAPADPPSTGG